MPSELLLVSHIGSFMCLCSCVSLAAAYEPSLKAEYSSFNERVSCSCCLLACLTCTQVLQQVKLVQNIAYILGNHHQAVPGAKLLRGTIRKIRSGKNAAVTCL